jgi:hypothetical protein
MKKRAFILALASVSLLVAGCVNPNGTPNNAGTGVLAGGAMGALTGAAIGGRCHAGPDALIGAAAGAVVGGLVGLAADQEQNARIKAQTPPPYVVVPSVPPASSVQPTGIADVEAMTKAGVTDDVIIAQIQNTRTVYHLAAADVIGLRNAGVSDKVLNFMITTPTFWATR